MRDFAPSTSTGKKDCSQGITRKFVVLAKYTSEQLFVSNNLVQCNDVGGTVGSLVAMLARLHK